MPLAGQTAVGRVGQPGRDQRRPAAEIAGAALAVENQRGYDCGGEHLGPGRFRDQAVVDQGRRDRLHRRPGRGVAGFLDDLVGHADADLEVLHRVASPTGLDELGELGGERVRGGGLVVVERRFEQCQPWDGEAIRRGIWYVNDPGGLFTIEGVAQGTYVLLARGETASGPLIGIASTDVALGSVEDVRLLMRRPGAIEGRMVVEGAGTTPFADLRVSPVQMLLKLSPLYPIEVSFVSEDGRFEIPHLGGEYTIDVDGLPRGWRVRRTMRNGTLVPDSRIVAPLGERVTGIEIVIGSGST